MNLRVPQINDGYRTQTDQLQRMSTPTPNIAVADLKREPSWHQLGYVTDLLVATQYGKTIDQTLFTWDAPNIVSVMSEAGFNGVGHSRTLMGIHLRTSFLSRSSPLLRIRIREPRRNGWKTTSTTV